MLIMKRIIVFFAVVVQMLLLPCCVEKQGYYSSGEESIIALICDITWTGGKKEYEDGNEANAAGFNPSCETTLPNLL